MFPARERRRFLSKAALTALLLATEIIYLGLFPLNFSINSNFTKNSNPTAENSLKDNWEIITYDSYNKEKLNNLAEKYNADPQYLDYIVKVEKTFDLEPCDLLALIAQESGFRPQTHMDGGSLSYNTTQMKMPTAKTAYMAITEYYKMDIPYPTDELLKDDKNYAALLAGGYLRYLQDTYNDIYESYTAYNWGIGGRMIFYKNNGNFKSPYAVKVASLSQSFKEYVGEEYKTYDDSQIDYIKSRA